MTIAAVNTRYRSGELQHILRASGARLLVYDPSTADHAAALGALGPDSVPELATIAGVSGAAGPSLGRERVAFAPRDGAPTGASDPDAPLVLFPTSGTTSAPKLAVHTQRTLATHAVHCARAYGFDVPESGYLAAMPLCGVFGMAAFLAAMAGRASTHLVPSFDADVAADLVRHHRITHLIGSDEMFRRLLDEGDDVLAGTRFCGFAAFTPGLGPVMADAARRGVPLRGVYGSSEVLALFAGQPAELPVEQRVEAGGRPAHPQAAVRVVDPESGDPVPRGTQGILEIQSPTNFVGYHADPVSTRASLTPDGWFRTGDVGHLRRDGTFVFVGRAGDALRLSGFLVAPAEIEAALEGCDGVSDAQVVGVDVAGRTRVVAFVKGSGADPAAVRAEVAEQLAHFKVPERVVVVDGFPTVEGANGIKVQNHRLREMALDELQHQVDG